MKKTYRFVVTALVLMMVLMTTAMPAFAAETTAAAETAASESSIIGDKAMAAAIVVGVAAAVGAIGMAWAIAKAVEGIARQPEAEGKIRTTMMLGLVFVETAIIYALVIAILIIFVL